MKLDESWTPAYVGFARTLANENPPAAAAAAEAALKVYPAFADAKLFLAELDLDNTRYDRARERIDQVLESNASHLDARSLLAAIAYVRGDKAAYDAEVGRVLAINPAFGEVYRVAGDLAARNYRFDEAVALARRATTLDPGNIRAASDLGLHLMRTGDEAEARRVLDRAFKTFPYDKVTFNLLALLDKLEKFEVVQEGDLIFKFQSRRSARAARVRDSARAGSIEEAVRLVSVHAEGPDPHRDLSGARRFRGPQSGTAGTRRRPRCLLRPRRQHGLSEGEGARRVFMAGDAVARAGARDHASDVESTGAALADRGRVGVRGSAREAGVGRRDGSVVRDCARARPGAEAARSELGIHQARHDRARVLPGLAPRRAHRLHARRGGTSHAAEDLRRGRRG